MLAKTYLIGVLDFIAMGFELAGVIALLLGTLYTLFYSLHRKLQSAHGISIDYIRWELGRSIALALEFFVAGDIIKTIITPDYYQIGLLSILVIIRTVLTYFLNKEISTLPHK